MEPPQTANRAETAGEIAPRRHEPIRSDALFKGCDEILIDHRGEQYRLRRTRNGKLILTK